MSFGNSKYDLIDKVDDDFQQKFFVQKVKTSGIGSVSIFSRGDGYKVNDLLNLDNTGTDGSGVSVVVGSILGKDVSTIEVGISTYNETELQINGRSVIGITSIPHDFEDGETIHISGITTQFAFLSLENKELQFQNVVLDFLNLFPILELLE